MIKLGIIEDNAALAQLVQDYFEDDQDVSLVVAAVHLDDFFSKVQSAPDVLLLDLNLPFTSGKDGIRQLVNDYPNMSIVVFSVSDDQDTIFKCLCDGAKSYLSKGEPLDKVKETIISTFHGGSNMSVDIARKVIDFFRGNVTVSRPQDFDLNEREWQVTDLILEGKSYKMVADNMGISINTVRKYIKSIYRKLNINSNVELMNKVNPTFFNKK